MDDALSDQDLLLLHRSVAMLDPRHTAALDRSTALVVLEELLELRATLARAGVQAGELQLLLSPGAGH
jgi:hypothetical protein